MTKNLLDKLIKEIDNINYTIECSYEDAPSEAVSILSYISKRIKRVIEKCESIAHELTREDKDDLDDRCSTLETNFIDLENFIKDALSSDLDYDTDSDYSESESEEVEDEWDTEDEDQWEID